MSNLNQYGEVGQYNENGWTNEDGVQVPSTQLDLGDGTQRTGMFLWVLNALKHDGAVVLNRKYTENTKRLKGSYGSFRRASPDSIPMWYNDTDRMSRDQATGLLVGLATTGQTIEILKFIGWHLLRLMLFTTNIRRNGTTKDNNGDVYNTDQIRDYSLKLPDLTGPDFWALEIRAVYASLKTSMDTKSERASLYVLFSPMILLLSILDLDMLFSVLYFNIVGVKHNVVDNMVLKLCFSRENLNSPVSALAFKLVNKATLIDKLNRFFNGSGAPDLIAKMYTVYFNKGL